MRKITLVVDEKWYQAIADLTNDVYDGETCRWIENREIESADA